MRLDVLLWTPTHARTTVGRPVKIYIMQSKGPARSDSDSQGTPCNQLDLIIYIYIYIYIYSIKMNALTGKSKSALKLLVKSR